MISIQPILGRGFLLLLLLSMIPLFGCRSQENHITIIDVPSGPCAGVATERGVLVLKQPVIKDGDIYSIRQVYGNSAVTDEARVLRSNEYLAVLEPISANLNNARFLRYPLEPEEELYIGVVDEENDPQYLPAELLEKGIKGDLVLCNELEDFPEPVPENGYGGAGLFAYRDGYLWLAGILTSMKATVNGVAVPAYPFVGMDKIVSFIPELKDLFTHEKKPFRPDFEYGVRRDGTGE